jgi:O-antigen/teichoic acid export membrane protein
VRPEAPLITVCNIRGVAAGRAESTPFTAAWVFGRQWADAGLLISALAPLCMAQSVVSPISRGLLLNGCAERKLLADLVCLIPPNTTVYLMRGKPMFTAVACYSAAAVLALAVYYVVMVKSLQRHPVPDTSGLPGQAAED